MLTEPYVCGALIVSGQWWQEGAPDTVPCEVIGSQLDVGRAEVLLEPVELGGAGDRPTSDQRVPS